MAKELLEKGTVARGYSGFNWRESFEAADAIKLGMGRVQGALVEAFTRARLPPRRDCRPTM